MSLTPEELFKRNAEWANEKLEGDSEYFSKLADVQTPKYLWIGCSDSRVPATQIVGLEPGDLFVHRNVANCVPNTDTNSLAVIQYAVEVLKVEHVVVAGHYNCGGVKAALGNGDHGQINNWLANIKVVLNNNYDEVMALPSEAEQVNRLCELNVIHQAQNVANNPILQKAWQNGQNLTVHGWIYDLRNGQLKDLNVDMSDASHVDPAYKIGSSA